jgi:hypothetical protein
MRIRSRRHSRLTDLFTWRKRRGSDASISTGASRWSHRRRRHLSASRRENAIDTSRNRGIRAKEGEAAGKLLTAFLRKAGEGVIGKLIVEAVILLSASKQADGGKVLRAAAQAYKVDTDAIALKVKYEFAAKEKARQAPKPIAKAVPKIKKAA